MSLVRLAVANVAIAALSACVISGAPKKITVTTGASLSSSDCLSAPLLQKLGKQHLLVGATMSDASAALAPFDLRYVYLSGALADGAGPCASCATGCTADGTACDNQHGCGWWGCWQNDRDPPGAYVRDLLKNASAAGQVPMFTYYILLQASHAQEGQSEVLAAADAAFMARYFADWRFVLQAIGQSVAILHLEPDFWGYAEQLSSDPHAAAAAVASANPVDCAGQENSLAGMARCLISMVRKYAPNAAVGLHGSGWGTKVDVLLNKDHSLDVAGEAQKLGDFLLAAGAVDADFVAVDASDRDAGFYRSQGKQTFWDDQNKTLPNFTQAFTWAGALARRVGKPIVWWQVPVGNMTLPNQKNAWQDNRVDYFFAHLGELVASEAVALAFGAGQGDQTTPESDGGNLIAAVQAYAKSPQMVCQ